jgi:23S rRNA pseudouridine1911/1915/1917 synthase
VHLSHIGHSIVGDQTYGNNRRKMQGCPDSLKDVLYAMNRQALHSFYISFIHPRNGNRMDFKTELPKEYEELVEFIRKAS